MRQSGNEKTRISGLIRRENAAITRLFPSPTADHAQSSGTTLVVVFLAALIGISLLLALFTRLWLSHYETSALASMPSSRISMLNQETDILQKHLLDLVSGSIEAKLQTIEKSIQQGQVSAADLQTLDELRQELRILANYSTNAQAIAADPMLIRGGIPRISADVRSVNGNADELSFVRGLYYFSLVSVSVVSLLAGGYWLQQIRSQRRLPPGMINTRPMLSRRRWITPEE